MSDNPIRTVRTTSYGWFIQVLSARLDVMMNEKLRPLDLNLRQFAIMMTVLETQGLTQNEIGSRFSMSAHACSRALDHLEKAGYVERRAHATSRRAHQVFVTKKGQEIAPALLATVHSVNAELVEPLNNAEQKLFGELLGKLLKAPRC